MPLDMLFDSYSDFQLQTVKSNYLSNPKKMSIKQAFKLKFLKLKNDFERYLTYNDKMQIIRKRRNQQSHLR